MKFAIALVFSLSVAASSSQAAVGFHFANGDALSNGRITVTSLLDLRKSADSRIELDYLRMPLVVAQAGQQTQQVPVYTMADGYVAGRITAEDMSTFGHFLGGFACGFLTGLIGTGVLWGVTGGDDFPLHLNPNVQEKGSDYSMGFMKGYKERTKQEKRGARLDGGLLGTAGFLVLYFYAVS